MRAYSTQRYEVNAWQADSSVANGRSNVHTKRFANLADARTYLNTFVAVGDRLQYFSGEILDRAISPGSDEVVQTL